MDTMNEPALAVLDASALIMGCGSRGEFADRQTGGTNENATRTVRTVKAPDGVEEKEEVLKPRGDETRKNISSYASVNGLKMYDEIHGAGRPLVLLHGGLTTIDSSFEKVLPSLAKTRQVSRRAATRRISRCSTL